MRSFSLVLTHVRSLSFSASLSLHLSLSRSLSLSLISARSSRSALHQSVIAHYTLNIKLQHSSPYSRTGRRWYGNECFLLGFCFWVSGWAEALTSTPRTPQVGAAPERDHVLPDRGGLLGMLHLHHYRGILTHSNYFAEM